MDDPASIVGRGPVLILAPHPDDESLGCGALLAACWGRGIAAHVACLTDGAMSHPGSARWPAERIAALRWCEMEAAIAILGGDPLRDLTSLGHCDAALHRVAPDRLATEIAGLVDHLSARVLLSPSPHDPHCDHVAAACAAERVVRQRPDLRLGYYPVWSRWIAGGDAPTIVGTRRATFRDAAHDATKTRAIAAHASQRGGVIDDDPAGFTMPKGFAEMFAAAPELYDVRT